MPWFLKKIFWSRGLVKSHQKNWRESRSRETEVGEKIAVTSSYLVPFQLLEIIHPCAPLRSIFQTGP